MTRKQACVVAVSAWLGFAAAALSWGAESDPSDAALASCKKHVESMLHESAETHFQSDREMTIRKADAANYEITGWVTSKTNAGETRRGDFTCHASRYGGSLWTTKTSLALDH